MKVEVIDSRTDYIYCRGELMNTPPVFIQTGSVDELKTIDGVNFFKISGCEKYFVKTILDPNADDIQFSIPSNCDLIIADDKDVKFINDVDFVRSFSALYATEFTCPCDAYEIIDKKSNDVIARGIVKSRKTDHGVRIYRNSDTGEAYFDPKEFLQCDLISFDNKHFFWTDGCDKYDVKKISTDNVDSIEYVEREDYVQILWRDTIERIRNADVIREYSIDECDAEIQSLVYSLNKIPHVHTFLSCCGHGREGAWVMITFDSVEGLLRLMNILKSEDLECRRDFFFDVNNQPLRKTNAHDADLDFNAILQVALTTHTKGEYAYKSLQKLSEYIDMLYEGA